MEKLDFLKFKPRQFTMSPFEIRRAQLSWQSKVLPNRVYFHAPFPKIKAKDEMNVFRQVDPSEPLHSRILCELLDPKGKHGKGGLFLSLFFECVGLEVDFNDTWLVTAEKERYDIRIRNSDNSCIIIIENKSNWAQDQPNQLYRYWYYGIYIKQILVGKVGKYKPAIKEIYYLSPNEFKSPDSQTLKRPDDFDPQLPETMPLQWKAIFFNKEIVSWLDSCLSAVENNTNIYFYIKQYLSFWRGAMSIEIVKQATDFFKDDKEQWNLFLDLSASKDEIRNSWYGKLKEKMNETFAKNNLVDKWSYEISYDTESVYEYGWYLSDFGRESVGIWLSENSLYLWAEPSVHNTKLLARLLQKEKYSPIISCFERIDEINYNDWLIAEKGNFSFDDPNDGHFYSCPDKLAWFAHFETDKMLEQIVGKIDRFRKNETVTNLLTEINKETKKITNG